MGRSTDPARLSQALKQLRTWQILLKTTYIFILWAVRRDYFVHSFSPKIILQVFLIENQERVQSSLKFCYWKWMFLSDISSLVNSLNVLKEHYFRFWANTLWVNTWANTNTWATGLHLWTMYIEVCFTAFSSFWMKQIVRSSLN